MKIPAKNPQKTRNSNRSKSRLRSLLESYLGEVSDKTWQRIRNCYLDISNEFLFEEHELAVRGYGLKRLLRSSDSINRAEAEIFGLIAAQFEFLFEDIVYGSDLRDLCAKCFKRYPSTRWFNDRGIHMSGVVTREQGLMVLAAIVTRKKFMAPKGRDEIPQVKRIVGIGQFIRDYKVAA